MLFFSCVLRDSMTSYVGQSVTVSFFGVFGRLFITAPAQMLKLAFFITAPAHPHATSVAVYPALFFFVADMQRYKRLCPSISASQKVEKKCFRRFCMGGGRVGCSWGLDTPAHLSEQYCDPVSLICYVKQINCLVTTRLKKNCTLEILVSFLLATGWIDSKTLQR